MLSLSRLSLSRPVAAMLVSLGASLFALVAAPPALAATSYDWYSNTSPLSVSEDGQLRGSAFGTAYQKNAFLKNHTFYKDRRNNGNSVYTETTYSYYKVCDGVLKWCGQVGKDQSARTSSADWQDQYDADDYSNRGADRGRVHAKVCEDQSWSPDPCSRKPYYSFLL